MAALLMFGIVIAVMVIDHLSVRLVNRLLLKLADRLPPYRPGGRYRSQSAPEKYASLRRPLKRS